ncbi:hypothetical protein [uncultured Brachyspira sp.]|uniref:hypothetical protein n=1 Tax=uncultured Brachyspira sp. TaxID=221953 RepID=UPI0025EE574B|nr:hypothetical protein [uncultured Brachyspira sp.]
MNNKNQKAKHSIGVYIIIIISIIIYFIGFIWYNEESKRIYKTSLSGITNMFYNINLLDTNNIISNHNFINNRILFLEERIAHYQNDSNHFASLWLALLSVLFIIITGFNLYNYNSNNKKIERDLDLLDKFKENVTKFKEEIDDISERVTSLNIELGDRELKKEAKNSEIKTNSNKINLNEKDNKYV